MIDLHRALLIALTLIHAGIAFTAHAGELDDIQHLVDKGRHQEVLDNVQRYLLQHTDNKRALFIQALTLQQLGRNKEAIASYEHLTRRYPDSPEPWNNLAVLYAASGDHNKARDALLSALNTHASYATAYENLGNIYAKMAVSAYNRALETGKKDEASAIALVTIEQLPTSRAAPAAVAQIEQPATSKTAPAAVAQIEQPPTSKTAPVTIAQLAASPVAVIADTKTGNNEEIRNIIDTVNGWSSAWAAQNVEGYLAYYAPGFKPASGLSRSRWEKKRRKLLETPSFIKITIKNTDVFMIDTRSARFSFEQDYTSDRFADSTRKTLMLKKINGQWQILREYAES